MIAEVVFQCGHSQTSKCLYAIAAIQIRRLVTSNTPFAEILKIVSIARCSPIVLRHSKTNQYDHQSIKVKRAKHQSLILCCRFQVYASATLGLRDLIHSWQTERSSDMDLSILCKHSVLEIKVIGSATAAIEASWPANLRQLTACLGLEQSVCMRRTRRP